MATQRDYYDILGVPRGADDDDIKRAFRKQAQQWHPDVNTSTEADVRFKEINEAYQVLSDPQRRQAYDMFGHAAAGGGAGGLRSIRRPVAGGFQGGFQGFGDLFDTLFGGAAACRAPASRADRRGPPLRPAADLRRVDRRRREGDRVREPRDLRDVRWQRRRARHVTRSTARKCNGSGELRNVRQTMLGQMVNVTPCDQCRGTGKIVADAVPHVPRRRPRRAKRKLRVTVPAGIDDGHQIRLSGEGEAAPRGGAPGNLYVVAHVAAHPQLRRQDTELYYDLPLSITQAALGARVRVPTADGDEVVEIKPGTQAGARDPPARTRRAAPAPHRRARRRPRDGRRARPDPPQRASSASSSRSSPSSWARSSHRRCEREADDVSTPQAAADSKRSRRRDRNPGLRDRLRDAIS